MAGIDKVAIGWTIAIVAAGVGIAIAGPNLESGSGSEFAAPTISAPTVSSDDKIAAAKAQIAKEQAAREESKDMMSADKMSTEKSKDDVKIKEDVSVKVDSPKVKDEPQTHMVSMPEGAGIPGCETDNACYVPADITISAGDTVIWSNDEQVPHTVAAGDLMGDRNAVGVDYPNGFASQLMAAGDTFEWTFEETGTYPYFCTLHPWMVGTVQVN